MEKTKLFANIALIIFLYYLVYFIYVGLLNPIPSLGDSWDYHIPISQTIINGSFLFPTNFQLPQWYYPGSSEAINALLLLAHIPLTISNILAVVVLFFVCFKLAQTFHLKFYYAIFFACTIVTLNTLVRWYNAVSIDIWLAVFFLLAIILLERPQKKNAYFLKLGFILGMFIGTKYTALLFLPCLLLFYTRTIIPYINPLRTLFFFVPFSIFGLFWYIRNYLATGNPFYPLPVLGFQGPLDFQQSSIWSIALLQPGGMLNAGFGEYKIWFFSCIIAIAFLINKFFVKRHFTFNAITKLFLIGLINIVMFLMLPTSTQEWIMVSSYRYSLPAFIPLVLGVFLLATKYNKQELLGYVALASMIHVLSMAYYPKLILIYLPIALFIIYKVSARSSS